MWSLFINIYLYVLSVRVVVEGELMAVPWTNCRYSSGTLMKTMRGSSQVNSSQGLVWSPMISVGAAVESDMECHVLALTREELMFG